jgi:hypothetical protein
MKTIFNICKVPVIIEQSENSKIPINFKHRDFSECPILLGRNEKNNIYNFPKQTKISKIA